MFKVIENRFFSVIFEWYQHALASMIYWKNCLKTILQSWEWVVLADKDIFKLLMQYKYVETSGFKNPAPSNGLGLSF